MKKLFSLIAAVLFAGSMMAADATIAKGTTNSYDDVTINGKPAVKMGKSSAGGDMTITVGKGATKLKFHAVAWKGEGDQKVTITAPAGVTATPDSIVVTANENLTGTAKAFEVTPEADYLFTIDLAGVGDAGAVLTLTSAKRAIVWGAEDDTEGEDPEPDETVIYDWAGKIGTTILGTTGVTLDTAKIHNNTDKVPAIKFANSYVYAEGKWIAIKPAEGGFKKGDVLYVAGVFSNDATDGSKYAMVDVYAADTETRLFRGDTVVNGKKSAADPVVEKFVLEADQDSLLLGRYGNTNLFVLTLMIGRPNVEPEPVLDTLTCAGAAEAALAGKTDEVFVKGYVTEIAYAWASGSMSFWMADAKDGGKVFEAYRCAIAKEEDAVIVGDLVLAKGKLVDYFNKKDSTHTPELAAGCTVEIIEKAERPEPIAADTITCAKAAEDALAGKTDEVLVKGYVTEIATEWSSQYKNISFWMADAKDGGKVIQAFRAACEKEADAPLVGDLLVVKGKLKDYVKDEVHTPELDAGCTFEFIEKVPRPEPQPEAGVADTITVAKAIELGMALDSMATDTVIYAVEGYVINAGNISMTYKNQIWFMADEATATASDFEAYNCFAIEGNDTLKVLDGDKVQLVGKLKKYYNRNEQKYIIEIEKGNASFISKVEGDHSIKVETEEVTVAKALEIGAALGDNKATEKMYKITAYVSAINVKPADAYSDQYGNQSFWVADDANSTASTNADGAFYVYRGKPSTEKEIAVGSKVEFTCTIKKYVPNGGGDPVIENADQNIVITVLAEPAGPELPEGVISCDSAVVLAAQIEDPVEVKSTTTGPEVKVWGYVTYAYNASEKDGKVTQSAWLSDTKGAKSGVIQGAYLEIASMESAVVVGDYVQIEGTLAKYLKEGKDGKPNEVVIEVINGRMCKVGEEGIENVVLTEKAQKVIVDGVLYIIRDNKMYNIQGMQVR